MSVGVMQGSGMLDTVDGDNDGSGNVRGSRQ